MVWRIIIIIFISILVFNKNVKILSADEIKTPHHVYVGIYTGGDKSNPKEGGWDNDDDYSVDREMVNWQNRNFAFEMTFMTPDFNINNVETNTYQELELIWYYGRVPIVNLTYDSWQNCQKTWVQIDEELSNPSSYTYQGLINWAKGLKKWFDLGKLSSKNNRFLFLVLFQEPNYSHCAIESNKSTWDFVDPKAFKSAFRKARTIIESVVGADYKSKIHWIFAPNRDSNQFMPGFEEYYPGDDVVDWVGLSAYNYGGYKIGNFTFPWQYFREFAKPYFDRIRKMAPSKPLALLQTGSISFGGDKNAWLKDLFNEVIYYPKLYIVIYFNKVKKEYDSPLEFDWPVFWNDPYDATPYGYDIKYDKMRYTGWLEAINTNQYLIFSPIPMPPPGAFKLSYWDITGRIAPISNNYDLFPELRDKDADYDGDGISNYRELQLGLDPLVKDIKPFETNCHDGIDNDGNGRIDEDDTVYCGDLPLLDGISRKDTAYANEERYFKFIVPSGASKVVIQINSIVGNVDGYIKKDSRPTLNSFDYRTIQGSASTKEIVIINPKPGTWHLLVYANSNSSYEILVMNSIVVSPQIDKIKNAIACDIDGNGQDDLIIFTDGYGLQAYVNNKQWWILDGNVRGVVSLFCGDINGDRLKDLIAYFSDGSLKFFDMNGWTWIDISLPGDLPSVMVIGDLNGDDYDDILATFKNLNSLKYRDGKTGNWYNIPLGNLPLPEEILIYNMDTDKEKEIIGVFRSLGKIKVYDNGTWNDIEIPSTQLPDIIAIADVDNDGIGDIVAVWRSSRPFSVSVRSGYTKSWYKIREPNNEIPDLPEAMPTKILIADVDGDAKDDIIAVWSEWRQVQVYRQFWNGWQFIYNGSLPSYLVVASFDGDTSNRKDIAFIWSNEIKLWLNNYQFIDVKNQVNPEPCTPPFIDVFCDHWAINYISAVMDAGITKGCNPPENDRFCPEDVVTRAQMAAFIIRAIEGEPTSSNANPYFADVSPTHWAFKYVQRVKERGIAQGYSGTNLYGPEDNVTREQMAKMLIMGLVSQGKISEPPSDYCASGSPFSDVDSSSWSCRYIKRLKELGITQGCNPPANDRYCPQDVVTRAQMAAFIYRAFLNK
jgi:hypothetical protein